MKSDTKYEAFQEKFSFPTFSTSVLWVLWRIRDVRRVRMSHFHINIWTLPGPCRCDNVWRCLWVVIWVTELLWSAISMLTMFWSQERPPSFDQWKWRANHIPNRLINTLTTSMSLRIVKNAEGGLALLNHLLLLLYILYHLKSRRIRSLPLQKERKIGKNSKDGVSRWRRK